MGFERLSNEHEDTSPVSPPPTKKNAANKVPIQTKRNLNKRIQTWVWHEILTFRISCALAIVTGSYRCMNHVSSFCLHTSLPSSPALHATLMLPTVQSSVLVPHGSACLKSFPQSQSGYGRFIPRLAMIQHIQLHEINWLNLISFQPRISVAHSTLQEQAIKFRRHSNDRCVPNMFHHASAQ